MMYLGYLKIHFGENEFESLVCLMKNLDLNSKQVLYFELIVAHCSFCFEV